MLIESPNKAHHIEQALLQGMELEVIATNGHLTQLYSGTDWDPLTAEEPRWNGLNEMELAIYQRVALLWYDLEALYIATDPDAEGECIAWHFINRVQEHLPSTISNRISPEVKVKRMRFYSLVNSEIKRAYDSATEGLDIRLVKSALTRTILDQIISRHYPQALGLNKANSFSAGIGRVQLAILDIVNQHKPKPGKFIIEVNVPLEDNLVFATFVLGDEDGVVATLFPDKHSAQQKVSEISKIFVNGTVALRWEALTKQLEEYHTINTATFLALAYRCYQFLPSKTMTILQSLYEGQVERSNETIMEL